MTGTYQLKDVERRLAEEAGTAELGIHLTEHGDKVVVHGEVSSEGSRQAVLERVRGLCPGREVVDELTCAEQTLSSPPHGAEELR
jgi:hypothetical protein